MAALMAQQHAAEAAQQRQALEAQQRAVIAAQQQRLEMESKVQSVRDQRAEAEAKLAVDEGTYKRLKAASATPIWALA